MGLGGIPVGILYKDVVTISQRGVRSAKDATINISAKKS